MTNLKNTASEWGLISRLFHWISALIILSLLAVGFIMTSLPADDFKWQLYSTHKAVGVILLGIITIRVIWRLSQTNPSLPSMPRLLTLFSKLSVPVLYLSLFTMTISGILMSNAGGYPISIFGWLELPALIEKNSEIASYMNEIHEATAWVLVGLISIHIIASCYHQFVRQDQLLRRMWSGKAGKVD